MSAGAPVGVAIQFDAFFTASGLGATGLTVTVDVYRGATEIVTAGSATEVGDGLYTYSLASGSVNAVGAYRAVFKTAGTADQQHIAARGTVGLVDVGYIEATDATDALLAAASAALAVYDPPTHAELTAGLAAADDATLAAIAALNNLSSVQAQAAAAAALTAYGASTYAGGDTAGTTTLLTRITALLQTKAQADTDQTAVLTAIGLRLLTSAYTAPPSVAAIADQVWDELLAGHVIAGSAGALLATAGAAADPMLNTPGDYASGTLGYYIGRLAGGRITVQATTTATGAIPEIVAGADYLAEDGRAFEWTDAEEVWPDLTGATITFCARSPGGVTVEHAGSVITPTGEKVVRVELTDTQTAYLATIRPGGWSWCVWAELDDGNLIPLVRGATPVLVVVGPPEA